MPDKALDRLAAAIRTARNQREMTQETLSDLSGVSVRHIGKIENGEINPSFEVLLSLVTALKISFDTLFYLYTSCRVFCGFGLTCGTNPQFYIIT